MKDITNYLKNTDNPFLPITPESNYWIGYIFADGHLAFDENKRIYSISLFSKNEDIINRFVEFLGPKAKKYKRPTGICQGIYSSKTVTKWFMDAFNIPSKKAIALNPSVDINWDIIHGYFDGDGCIRLTKYKNRWPRYEASITTGSQIWASRVEEFLLSEGINCYIKYKGGAYAIYILGKANLYYFYKKIYQSETSKLDYKYNQFEALFGNKQ